MIYWFIILNCIQSCCIGGVSLSNYELTCIEVSMLYVLSNIGKLQSLVFSKSILPNRYHESTAQAEQAQWFIA